MENKIKEYLGNKYFKGAVFFLVLQIIISYYLIVEGSITILIWFCNHSPILFSIAFFLKNKGMIKGLINFGLLVQIVWIVDFFNVIITGNSLFGVTNYLFESENFSSFFVPIVVHMFGVLVAFLITFKEKPSKKDLIYSGTYIVLLYLITLIFTNPEFNINCIQKFCLEEITFPYYTLFWPVGAFVVVVLLTQGIRYLIWKRYSKNKNTK